nr:unnamed protein product [Callosobruchus chinensis]
MRDFLQH